jgi:hypothetical protein
MNSVGFSQELHEMIILRYATRMHNLFIKINYSFCRVTIVCNVVYTIDYHCKDRVKNSR